MDDLKPRRSRSGRAIGGKTPDGGVIVKVTQTGGQQAPQQAPTRYSLGLRRQAANRIRLGRGEPTLPPLRPGQCARCDGWGVVGSNRARCPTCGGSGR